MVTEPAFWVGVVFGVLVLAALAIAITWHTFDFEDDEYWAEDWENEDE